MRKKRYRGVLDYKPDSEVYLSLFMLDLQAQGNGIGREIYTMFEHAMIEQGKKKIRIDVVNDYPENILPFWKKMGFQEDKKAELIWGN